MLGDQTCERGTAVAERELAEGDAANIIAGRRRPPTDEAGNKVRHGTRDKINRLRERVRRLQRPQHLSESSGVTPILLGILDLLEDEL